MARGIWNPNLLHTHIIQPLGGNTSCYLVTFINIYILKQDLRWQGRLHVIIINLTLLQQLISISFHFFLKLQTTITLSIFREIKKRTNLNCSIFCKESNGIIFNIYWSKNIIHSVFVICLLLYALYHAHTLRFYC